MEERGWVAMLNFYGKLCAMDERRLAKQVFLARANQLDRRNGGAFGWCVAAKEAMVTLGFASEWAGRRCQPKWKSVVKAAAAEHFLKEDCIIMQGRPRLDVFHELGAATTREWLDRPMDHPGVALRFRLRCGGAPLMTSVRQEGGNMACPMCDTGDDETAQHFACHCPKYEAERQDCMSRVLELIGDVPAPRLRDAIANRHVALFLGDARLEELSPDLRLKVDTVMCNYLKVAWRQRREVWAKLCVEGSEWRLL